MTGDAPCPATGPGTDTQLASGCGRGRPEALRGALDGRRRVARRGDPLALARAAELEQLGDDLREPVDLAAAPASRSSAWTGVTASRARLLEAQPQPGERRAQLMRGVRDELALGGEQRREPLGHLR